MTGEPGKIALASLLASLFIGAVAIAGYISQLDKNRVAADQFGLERDNASASTVRGDTMTGTVRSGPVAARSNSDVARARDLPAAHSSLQRNDRAAADAVHALPAARAEAAQQSSKSAQPTSPSPAKADRLRDGKFAAREHSIQAAVHTKTSRAPGVAVAADSSLNGRTASVGEAVVASDASATLKTVSTVANAPAAPQSGSMATPNAEIAQATETAPATQVIPSGAMPSASDSGPKTRAQVRAEITRARTDGSLPRFGNPDPAGPGGAPSLTPAPRP